MCIDIDDSKVDEFCTNNDVSQLINEVTRPTSGTLLDHIYTNIHNAAEHGTISFRISDHVPVYMLVKCERTKIKKKILEIKERFPRAPLKFHNIVFVRTFDKRTLYWKKCQASKFLHKNVKTVILIQKPGSRHM